MKAYLASIHLAADEWGNATMDRVARDYFAAHPHVNPLVVQVYEHAGWTLSYTRSGCIVGTANDMARLSDEARSFAESIRGATWEYLPHIRRDDIGKFPRLADVA